MITTNNNPMITALLPVYNCEEYLEEAIDSILNQTFKNFELLIIEDGSTDRSAEVIQSFSDPRIIFIKNVNNIGLIGTLNKGFEIARGKYIARMDQDDISLPKRLEKQVNFLEQNPDISVLGTAFKVFGGKSYTIEHPSKNEDIKANLLFFNSFCHPSVMFRRKSLDEYSLIYNKNYTHTEDYAFWTENANKLNYANLPEILLHWRWHNHGEVICNDKNNAQFINCKKIRINYLNMLGIAPNEQEILLHESIIDNSFKPTDKNLIDLILWFSKIFKATQNIDFIETNAMYNRLNSMMLRYLNSKKVSNELKNEILKSPFGKKLKIKSMIKLQLLNKFKV